MSLPPRMRALAPEEVDPAARPVFDRFLQERGNIPNLFRTLARRPEIMTAYANLLHAVTYTGTVDVQLKELCILRVSQINDSAY
ncbi:hypothetical protein caldi_02970 [Caldinitratiruptor microaerophilus]|uniref:Carboxymuconolactone decarboxylase-like domain-containing protein n=2 Tax=Caldinitratiruptor microaerophilus TaxID=671077 RepID=A0AA35CHW5_9FIRM|nr:hypothetical protein caldi_02970 [Caldinitratiruptor microaerophilus]